MIQGFEFQDAGRTYTCTIEERKGTDESWWWFAVSSDGQRYAPFIAAKSDTRTSVQDRVVAFYKNRLFQLSQPIQRGSQWGKRPDPKPAVAPVVVEEKVVVKAAAKPVAQSTAKSPAKSPAKSSAKPAVKSKAKSTAKSASK